MKREHPNDRLNWLEGFAESLSDRIENHVDKVNRSAHVYRTLFLTLFALNALALLAIGALL